MKKLFILCIVFCALCVATSEISEAKEISKNKASYYKSQTNVKKTAARKVTQKKPTTNPNNTNSQPITKKTLNPANSFELGNYTREEKAAYYGLTPRDYDKILDPANGFELGNFTKAQKAAYYGLTFEEFEQRFCR